MQKSKRGKPRSVGCFVLVWTGVLTCVEVLSTFASVEVLFQIGNLSNIRLVSAVTGIMSALLFSFVQVHLVQRLLKRSMRGWIPMVVASIVASWGLYFALMSTFDEISRLNQEGLYLYGILQEVIFSLPIVIFQGLWLSRRVKRAWLWALAILVINVSSFVILFIFPHTGVIESAPLNIGFLRLMITITANLILGLVLHYLLAHPNAREIARQEAAAEALRLVLIRKMELRRIDETVISRAYGEEQAAS
jgi:hypothetical protein